MTKTYIVTTEATQTLRNKTINAVDNTVTNIDVSNLKTQATTEAGKVWMVKSDGTWELGNLGSTAVDNVTIDYNASTQIEVKDGSATAGLSVAKFRTDAISTAIPTTGTAVNTKFPTELAVKTYMDGFGKTLEFTMDPTTFVLTAKLKDANGTVLSTQTVDLPLEQMVVNVTYDNVNEKFVFTLKDGTTIDVPASGILKGVVTQTATQTLTNKTIDADNNTISNLEADNLKALTAADEDKILIVKSDGSWENNYGKEFHEVSALPATGNTRFLYYLNTADATHKVGLYIYTGGAYVNVGGSADYDNVTIDADATGKLQIKDSGITFVKVNSAMVTTTIPATASAVDTKFPTEKAVATKLDSKIPYATGSTSTVFTIGEDASGYYIEE